jgi:hypothetical protein
VNQDLGLLLFYRSHLVAGGVAGCSAVLLLHPFDVVKTRLQGDRPAAAAAAVAVAVAVAAAAAAAAHSAGAGVPGDFKAKPPEQLHAVQPSSAQHQAECKRDACSNQASTSASSTAAFLLF